MINQNKKKKRSFRKIVDEEDNDEGVNAISIEEEIV